MADNKTTPTPAPGLDLDAAEKRAAGFRGTFRAMSYDSGDELLEFVSADSDPGDDVNKLAEAKRLAREGRRDDTISPALAAALEAL